jgi:5-methylcytosine-specific restriction endonuclease McrA
MVLNDATLVLNKGWVPIGFASVRRAMELLVTDRAQAILPDDYSVHNFDSWADLRLLDDEIRIRTVSLEIKVPEIIRLNTYTGVPQHKLKLSRRNLFRRDNCTCQYCGKQLKSEDATIDHVIPRALGGKTTWLNCVIACLKCNSKKDDKTLAQCGMRLIKIPVAPNGMASIRIPVFKKRISWDKFISEAYWNIELLE